MAKKKAEVIPKQEEKPTLKLFFWLRSTDDVIPLLLRSIRAASPLLDANT